VIFAALGLYLSASQVYWAQQAFLIGEPHNVGHTLVALEGQESSYCRFKGTSWSRGCLGIKRSTARLFDPDVTRDALTNDNYRNLHDGLMYLLYCKAHTKNWSHMVACYHWGLPHESKMSDTEIEADVYVNAIRKRMQEVKVSHD